ncbi:MAG: ATP-binding protein [Candidatus Aenigmarchaeota archaeon]|nr:ATP-binding protein [Candidatus Aenigmarchaeota archaeon]
MDLEILVKKNPWWLGKEHIKEDVDYRKWEEKKIKWTPEIVDKININPFSLHFIFGPRQVGKTTSIKLLIKKLLEKKNPKSIFYFRCDEIGDYKELAEVLNEYLEFREREKIDSSIILLDEITSPSEWWRTIKGFIDDGIFSKDTLILTGSASIEVKKEAEYFPGRRGEGKNFRMYPLSFKEFVKLIKPKIAEKLHTDPCKNSVYLQELNKSLSDYFICGGFPLAINSYFEKGFVEESVKETYLTWIKNDLTKTGRDDRIAREIIKVLTRKIPSPISFESISKETSIKSPKTISSYLHTLSDLFVLEISYFIDPNTQIIQFGKNKKIHFIDPLLFSIFEEWGLIKIKEKDSIIAESLLAVHLCRKHGNIFYWTNKEEIDSVIKKADGLIGYECKWQEKAKEKRIKIGKLKEVWTISKKDLKGKIIPLSLFLYSL